MTDTNKLITTVAYDIISITTIWALINSNSNNSFYVNIDHRFIKFNYSPIYSTIIGISASLFLLRKYTI